MDRLTATSWRRAQQKYVLEMSPSPCGSNSVATLLRFAAGLDLVDYSVRLACGDQP